MYVIDSKCFDENSKSYLYKLENINNQEITKFYSKENFNEGDIVQIQNQNLVFLENETINRKNNMQKRLNNLFNK